MHSAIKLLKTVCYSNNPAVIRVSKLNDLWLPMCLNDPLCRQLDLHGSSIGLENTLFKSHIKDVRRLGFKQAHQNWGTYIYGAYSMPPHIVHLGE
jgi:hypothetical protein